MSVNLEKQFDRQFEKKPIAEVMDKLYGMRDDVSTAFRPQYDKYCEQVNDILCSNPTKATKRSVLKLVENEGQRLVKEGNTAGTRSKIATMKEMHDASNDSYGSLAA